MTIRVGILTISDTASQDANVDKSGPAIRNILADSEDQVFECDKFVIVPDDILQIQRTVRAWCDLDIDWIITTGGTGFGIRDQTPEAITPLLDRQAPGLVHLMLSASLRHTPLAALSRPVAGTIKNTLIVTLPGSTKAVKENLEALLSAQVIGHAIELIRGGTGKSFHTAMSSSISGQGSHHHHHHHDHSHHIPQPRNVLSHDPSLPASSRHRISPYPLISFEKALEIILSEITPLKSSIQIVTPALRGHVLAEDVCSPYNIPRSATTNVDGYALRSTDPPGVYRVLTSKNHRIASALLPGFVYRINTGGPLPSGTDAVIMVEDTRLVCVDDDGEEKEIETLAQIPAGENIRVPGSDVKENDLVLERGERISSAGGELGTLAFVGRKEVKVYKKPIVAILSTGNEIVDLQSPSAETQLDSDKNDEWGGIWDTNRPSLQAALEGMGYEVLDLGIVKDDIPSHVSAIQSGLDSADILLTTGGTSMGPSDLLKPVIERQFEGTVHFGRVTIKPGKPTTFATIPNVKGQGEWTKKPLFALPGNPASALVTFYIFVVPALRILGGWPLHLCQLPRVKVQLQHSMNLDPRTEFHRVVIRAGDLGLKAYSTGGQRSSRVASLNGANGLVILPQRNEDTGILKLQEGELVNAVVIGELN